MLTSVYKPICKCLLQKYCTEFLSKRKLSLKTFLAMRFVQFRPHQGSDEQHLGVLKNTEQIIDLSGVEPSIPNSLVQYLSLLMVLSSTVKRAVKEEKEVYNLKDVKLLAPITKPDKVLCVGLNYKDHCDEQQKPYPEVPFFFNKFPSTIIGPDDDVVHPSASKAVDWEVELAVVIGNKCKNVDIENALDCVFGYTVAQDISARDWQTPKKNNGQWLLGKSMDTFCPLGPVIVTKDEIEDPHTLNISCTVNGELKQISNTKNLIHRVDKIVSFLSSVFTLLPGDVILTGTPGGVGVFRNPKEFLLPGDMIESSIEKIGLLRNYVSDS